MDGCISMVTIGVADLNRSRAFYEALGWVVAPQSQESVVFLQGRNIVLGLYGRQALAEDAGVQDTPPGFSGFALALNIASEAEVDRIFEIALANGARAQKPPQKAFWGGYSGYFADPDSHLWEIAHNPFFPMDADGNLRLLGEPA
jgi:catechol 2,3-dioxygenase-like lactoylglutathione lyase family enzyme